MAIKEYISLLKLSNRQGKLKVKICFMYIIIFNRWYIYLRMKRVDKFFGNTKD